MNKHTTIRAVARQTGLTYFQVQLMLEALIEVWSDELAGGGHITLENFLTIRVTQIKTHRRGKMRHHKPDTPLREKAYRADVRIGDKLKARLQGRSNVTNELGC